MILNISFVHGLSICNNIQTSTQDYVNFISTDHSRTDSIQIMRNRFLFSSYPPSLLPLTSAGIRNVQVSDDNKSESERTKLREKNIWQYHGGNCLLIQRQVESIKMFP